MRFLFILIILLLGSNAFSQTYFEIEPKPVFGDSADWIMLSDDIDVNLGQGTATFKIEAAKVVFTDTAGVHYFKTLIKDRITVSYSGQSITKAGQQTVAAAKFDLVYTGESQ